MPIAITHDFEKGDISEWYSNEIGGGAGSAATIDGNIVPGDRTQGRYGAKMTLANPQTRCELVMNDKPSGRLALFSEGEQWEFSWHFKLSAGWNNSNAPFQAIAQWYPYPAANFIGSPPISLMAGNAIFGDAVNLTMFQGTGQPVITGSVLTPLAALSTIRGSWVKIKVRIIFSIIASKSRIAVDINGATVMDAMSPYSTLAGVGPNGLADKCYFKIGYYRDSTIASTDSVHVDYVDARQI